MKILLVEDSKFLRLATGRALAHAGYEMTFAGDGDEALLMAGENLPDLILLDMMLPKMSGPDVLKALKKEPVTAAIPVVVLSTSAAELTGKVGLQSSLLRHQVAAETQHEFVVAVLLIAGKRRHHQLAFEAGDIERRHISGFRALLAAGNPGAQQAGAEQNWERDAHAIAPVRGWRPANFTWDMS